MFLSFWGRQNILNFILKGKVGNFREDGTSKLALKA